MGKWIDAKGWMKDDRLNKRQKVADDVIPAQETEEVTESEVVVYKPLKCKCGSRKVHCYGADRPILYYKCMECGRKFKVLERE